MAWNNYYPTYAPGWFNPQYIPQQPIQAPQSQTNRPAMSGFVRVQSEQEARAYPVAPGNSITFIDESRPYCYTKSVDMSQLDRPVFAKYRLVKEEDPVSDGSVGLQNGPGRIEPEGGTSYPEYALKSELVELRGAVEALQRRFGSDAEKDGGES